MQREGRAFPDTPKGKRSLSRYLKKIRTRKRSYKKKKK